MVRRELLSYVGNVVFIWPKVKPDAASLSIIHVASILIIVGSRTRGEGP